jgi:hypothetical protein
MAKVTIAGNAVVITSSMKLADLATIKKYRPKALRLMGGENNKEELFVVDVGNGGSGGLNNVGAAFCATTHDEAKKACITIPLDGVQGDVKEYVADKYGEALIHLNALEEKLPAVLTEITEQKTGIMANITVAG